MKNKPKNTDTLEDAYALCQFQGKFKDKQPQRIAGNRLVRLCYPYFSILLHVRTKVTEAIVYLCVIVP